MKKLFIALLAFSIFAPLQGNAGEKNKAKKAPIPTREAAPIDLNSFANKFYSYREDTYPAFATVSGNQLILTVEVPRGRYVSIYTCENDMCVLSDGKTTIQLLADGSFLEKHTYHTRPDLVAATSCALLAPFCILAGNRPKDFKGYDTEYVNRYIEVEAPQNN